MEYVTLKNSDLRVSRICLGTWLFGGRRWGRVDMEESRATIRQAFDEGINFFDTADAYGVGLSERLVGEILAPHRDDVVIATKVGVVWRNDGTRYHDLSPRHIREAVVQSLGRLRTDRIDLYQLHEMDGTTPIEETGAALRELVEKGLVRYVGVSNHDLELVERLRDIVPVVAVQAEYSLIKREIEGDLLPYAGRKGISLLAYSALYRGLLTGKFVPSSAFSEDDNRFFDDEFRGERFAGNLAAVDQLTRVARDLGKSPSQVAMRWLLDTPEVDAVIFGARSPDQLSENIGATGWTIPGASRELLDRAFSKDRGDDFHATNS